MAVGSKAQPALRSLPGFLINLWSGSLLWASTKISSAGNYRNDFEGQKSQSRKRVQSNFDNSKCQGPQEFLRLIGSSNFLNW